MAQIIPLITHLGPPHSVSKICVDRFSPYFQSPEKFGISNLQPHSAYRDLYPTGSALPKLAYHFDGDYDSCGGADSEAMVQFHGALADWRAMWGGGTEERPRLLVTWLGADDYRLIDTRQKDNHKVMSLTKAEARASIWGWRENDDKVVQRCLENKLALQVDGRFVPLAVTDLETMRELI
jgi:hypothetical protein